MVFGSHRLGVYDPYEELVACDATKTLLLASAEDKDAADWSADGRFILHQSRAGAMATGDDLSARFQGRFVDLRPIPA